MVPSPRMDHLEVAALASHLDRLVAAPSPLDWVASGESDCAVLDRNEQTRNADSFAAAKYHDLLLVPVAERRRRGQHFAAASSAGVDSKKRLATLQSR